MMKQANITKEQSEYNEAIKNIRILSVKAMLSGNGVDTSKVPMQKIDTILRLDDKIQATRQRINQKVAKMQQDGNQELSEINQNMQRVIESIKKDCPVTGKTESKEFLPVVSPIDQQSKIVEPNISGTGPEEKGPVESIVLAEELKVLGEAENTFNMLFGAIEKTNESIKSIQKIVTGIIEENSQRNHSKVEESVIPSLTPGNIVSTAKA